MKICVTFQKPGFHRYPDAPEDVAYLKNVHRHLFKFQVCIEVEKRDRELEFHQFLNWLDSLYQDSLALDYKSCEMLSDDLAAHINTRYPTRQFDIEIWEDGECGSKASYFPEAEVSEDGECGAVLEYTP